MSTEALQSDSTTHAAIELRVVESLADVAQADWDALVGPAHPFVSHGFLSALEATDCLEPQGWYSQHILATQGDQLVGAMPLYLRDNSYGEFVFDWSWAEAFERAGGQYYPKLVNAVPFSPVAGPRVLTRTPEVGSAIVEYAQQLTEKNDLSSLHLLFLPPSEAETLAQTHQTQTRTGVQYQWFNPGYADFDDFLARLTSRKRKEIRRERKKAQEADLELVTLAGTGIAPSHWDAYYEFYCATFYRKWGSPRLTRAFFDELVARLGDRVLLELALDAGRPVAGAFLVRGEDTLFGRHWGAIEDYKFLHFELCYYRPLDFCITNKIARFDAGAQGEHKLGRGFVPVMTASSHYLPHPSFSRAVADFLRRERAAVADYFRDCASRTAFNEESRDAALAAAQAFAESGLQSHAGAGVENKAESESESESEAKAEAESETATGAESGGSLSDVGDRMPITRARP